MSEPLPWLAQAVELEALATLAQIEPCELRGRR